MLWARFIWVMLAALVFEPANAWSPFDIEQEKIAMTAPETYGKVDYLTPNANPGPDDPECLLTFKSEPSFGRSSRWCLMHRDGQYSIRSWLSSKPERERVSSSFDHEVVIRVPGDVSDLLRQIWINVLLEARYPRFGLLDADGTTYYFGAKVPQIGLDLRGSTWSPNTNLPPAWIVSVGDTVSNFCRSNRPDEGALRTQLQEQRDRIVNYYKTHGWN